jgi:hypothetical protein
MGLTPFHRRSFLALQRTLAGDQLAFDLLGDPAASPEAHERLAGEAVPVMADDAMLDAADLVRLDAFETADDEGDPFDRPGLEALPALT